MFYVSPMLALAAMTSFAAAAVTQFCRYPDGFAIQNFTTFTPKGENEPTNIKFHYIDEITHLDVDCVYNGTQPNINADGELPRYLCDFKYVHFTCYAQKGNLTVFERLCYLEDQEEMHYDAIGWVKPKLDCCKSTNPEGVHCVANPDVVGAFFTGKAESPKVDE
ncbi:hypothetical protein VTJ49DRAFT_2530 [Mycothermus thermophilus]|uniref:Uncharacterized protein n=1 Tax=Humicola insolens TaxID=85995 RepID=A0ABR3VAF5_HUMIN